MAEQKLTEKEKAILAEVTKEWETLANGGNTSFDEPAATEALGKIYEFAGLKADVVFFPGPKSALEFCRKELGQDVTQFDAFGLGYDAGWISFYEFFQKIGKLPSDNKEFDALRQMVRAGVWATILFDKLVVAMARPNTVKLDDRNRLHCSDGPAVAFDDGALYFFWHGTRVSKKIIMTPEKLTAKEINDERNSEIVRAIVEKLGWPEFMKRIEVKLVDKWFDPATKLHYELYDFKNRRFELAPKLLKMESPEVLDGTRPTYIEPVHPQLMTCKAARKWQFKEARCTECKKTIPTTMIRHGDVQLIDHVLCVCGGEPEYRWPEPKECNERPELEFSAEA